MSTLFTNKTMEKEKSLAEFIITKNTGVEVSDLYSDKRDNTRAHARFALFWLLYEYFNWNTTDIQKVYNRHHTTVLHALKWVEKNNGGPTILSWVPEP